MNYLTKRKTFLGYMAGMLLFISCGNKDLPVPESEPEPGLEEIFGFKLKSTGILEFKKMANEKITEIDHDEAVNIFGGRIDMVTPKELQLNADSLTVVKPHGMVEKYAIKWKKNELFLSRILVSPIQLGK